MCEHNDKEELCQDCWDERFREYLEQKHEELTKLAYEFVQKILKEREKERFRKERSQRELQRIPRP